MTSVALPMLLRFGLLTCALLAVGYFLERRFSAFSRFLNEKSTALNLAIARIAVMGAMLAVVRLPYIQWFASLQSPLLYPIRIWHPWLLYRGDTSHILAIAYIVLVGANICGIIGFFGRFSCLVSALLFSFLMGVPQLFGQVNHTEHHLVIFALILASAPCSDTLSLDAVFFAMRNGDRRRFVKPRASAAYAFPIKAMLLVLSLFYLFPGIWKVARAGVLWFSGKNMQLLLAMKMYEAGSTPLRLWALNHLPIHALSSFGTIVFELGFIFAMLFPKLRPLAGIIGICFHGTIYFLMGINFGALVACYVILVNWTELFDAIAQRFSQAPIVVLFDGNCKLCRRTISILYNFDWLNRLTLYPNSEERLWPQEIQAVVTADAVADRFASINDAGEVAYGYHAYEFIAGRVPLLWPLRLLMFIPWVKTLGISIYEWVSHTRSCTLRDGKSGISINAPERQPGLGLMGGVAALVFSSMVVMGSTRSINAWPVSCFPTFDWPAAETQFLLSIEAIDIAGTRHSWTANFDPILGSVMTPERLQGMLRTFTNGNESFSKNRAKALLHLWTQYHPVDKPLTQAVFFADEYHVMPDRAEKLPITRRELGQVTLADGL